MIYLAAFLLLISLALGYGVFLARLQRELPRVLLLIVASGLFFGSFFLFMQQLHLKGYLQTSQESWLGELSTSASSLRLLPGEKLSLAIRVENQGTEPFDSTLAANPVFLSYHILSSQGEMLRFDNPRFAFGEPLEPKQEQSLVVVLDPAALNLSPGEYLVEFDLVREGAFWFGLRSRGAKTLRISLHVEGEES